MMTKSTRPSVKRFFRNTSGNVAFITALAIVPIISIAGFAVDYQLVITKKNTVQHTLDATLIAAARERQAGISDEQVRMFVRNQFANFMQANDPNLNCQAVDVVVSEVDEDINASVTCTQPTTLAAVFMNDHVNFTVSAGTTYGIGKIDVAFVFDLSGSMNSNGRLAALKTAAVDAVDTLLPTGDANNGDVRLSISTYNQSVNAGQYFDEVVAFNRRPAVLESSEDIGDIYASDIIGVVQIDSSNNRHFYDYETVRCDEGNPLNANNDANYRTKCDDYTDWAARFYYESTCVYNRRGDEAFTDAGPEDDAWIIAGHPVWNYRNNNNDNVRIDFRNKFDGENEAEDQIGQMRRGETPPSLVTNARGLDDTPDNAGSFRYDTTNGEILSCRPDNEPVPLTHDRSTLVNFINGMTANGGTAGHLGIAWGWYLLSPEWSDIWPAASEPHEYNADDTAKALIIMTDGEFNSTYPTDTLSSTEMAARYCDNIKADTNIVIFTVGFEVPDTVPTVGSTGKTIIDYCASRPEFAFNAANSQELLDAYSQIATSISELRITN